MASDARSDGLSFMPSSYVADYNGTYAPPEARYRIVEAGHILMAVGGTPLTRLLVTSSRESANAGLPRIRAQIPTAEVYELCTTCDGERVVHMEAQHGGVPGQEAPCPDCAHAPATTGEEH